MRITALVVSCSRLWVGTGNGVIISIPLSEGATDILTNIQMRICKNNNKYISLSIRRQLQGKSLRLFSSAGFICVFILQPTRQREWCQIDLAAPCGCTATTVQTCWAASCHTAPWPMPSCVFMDTETPSSFLSPYQVRDEGRRRDCFVKKVENDHDKNC